VSHYHWHRGYRAENPDGYGRTQFFDHYRRWAAKLPVWMRQTHRGGEKVFVDFSGDGIPCSMRSIATRHVFEPAVRA